MSVHNLLNLLNEFRKTDKIWGVPNIVSLFRNELNKFNNTGAQMLDSIHHMTLKLLKKRIFLACKRQDFAIFTIAFHSIFIRHGHALNGEEVIVRRKLQWIISLAIYIAL